MPSRAVAATSTRRAPAQAYASGLVAARGLRDATRALVLPVGARSADHNLYRAGRTRLMRGIDHVETQSPLVGGKAPAERDLRSALGVKLRLAT